MLSSELTEELLETLTKIKNKHKCYEPLVIVVGNETMAINVIDDNKQYNENYRLGYVEGYTIRDQQLIK